jgi:5-oxoprolinase (ATP-hydrolysing) subunit A
MTKSIDLNCDMGEGLDNDALLMPLISSANIACGYHAGDTSTMKKTIMLALKQGVAIGAHPGFPDKQNFGRKEMGISEEELFQLITDQIKMIASIANICGAKIHHVKPHGALYNMAAKDANMARVIASAVKEFNPGLILYGLSKSYLISEAKAIGLATCSELFADRTYQNDGSLTPRNQPNAMIETAEESLQQVLQMIQNKTVTTVYGKKIAVDVGTICIHGDGEQAVEFAKQINAFLHQQHIRIQSK